MTKYLDINKLEYNSDIVEVDDLIADTILELNKKGYITHACCSGHSKVELYPYELPLDKKEQALKENYVIYEEDDMIHCCMPNITTYTYVMFAKGYNFEKVPEGFLYETAEEQYNRHLKWKEEDPNYQNDNAIFGDHVGKMIMLMDENGKRRPTEEVDREIMDANKILLEWSKKLEPVNIKHK